MELQTVTSTLPATFANQSPTMQNGPEETREAKDDSKLLDMKEKMKNVGSMKTWQKEKDKMYFLYQERLADAERLKEIDRVDGRLALDDFVLSPDSIV